MAETQDGRNQQRARAVYIKRNMCIEGGGSVKPRILSAVVIAVLALAACTEQPPATNATPTPQATPTSSIPVATPTPWDREPPPRYDIGTSFSLKVGKSAEVDEGRLLVYLSAVVNDSRCPADVVCVRAGDVTAVLEMTSQDAGTTRAEVKFELDRPAAVHSPYRVVVADVQPYPRFAGTPIAAADYVVTMVVEP